MKVVVAVLLVAAVALAVALAITQRRRRLAERTVAGLHLGALVVDVHDRVVSSNRTGRGMGLLRGDQLAINELRDLARTARRHGAVRHAEVPLLHGWLPRDPTAVGARAVPLDRAGHVALIVEDRTEARRVADMRRDFIANVGHELKTPIGALSLLSEALVEGSDDPEAVRRFAARIHHEAARLTRLVQELIELSRLESADPVPDPRIVPIAEVIDEAVDRTRLTAAARHITISTESDTSMRVRGNQRQLVTALVNLIDNAIQYSADHTAVMIGAAERAGCVEVIVTDQGIGIDQDDLDRVFERFFRADPARSRTTGGTGLGLAIVKHVAVNHGGKVQVHSRSGQGSRFTLTLPAAMETAAEPAR